MAKLGLHNFGDGRDYNDPHADKSICSVVSGYRRKHLNVTWDLKVVPCCFDYDSQIIFGDLRKQAIREIYESDEYLTFINAHATRNLDAYPLCQSCDMR